MRAIVSRVPGGPETLELAELDIPGPGPGEVLVAVHAAALNYPDALVIADRYQLRRERPFVPAMEFSGRVAAVGEGVTLLRPGDRVMAVGRGALAEYAVAQEDRCFAIPPSMPYDEAAALLVTYGTALHALADRGRLAPGERLLVFGASGGVGLAAVQIGAAMGAQVVAAASTPAKVAQAAAWGADRTLVYPRLPLDPAAQKALGRAIAQACEPGCDVVFDPVGDLYGALSLRALAWGGRYLAIGFAAGIPSLAANLLLLKSADALGVYWGAWIDRTPGALSGQVEQLVDWWSQGRIKPMVSRVVTLDEAPSGFASLLERSATGKIVVRLRADP
ncbi:NADPH:quinone oxidoreductase family protein [Pararhodobacter aggregans]|uniref:NADPH:quinone oxidoreductase n=1 Tax=Pararhodobacter aggregans TaxID=404875 RepID=A0A2T7UTY7_9RHOB|nr:NADPH:quinone oxidoreductase family protein [Pararhodobacter aggregans]PTX03035.1 NADPH2:quinone reductase [Pararhodobacter aggregans]PVE48235.1 NADPH:quinone oxidoreductase [Pararhodobacter aggregans]